MLSLGLDLYNTDNPDDIGDIGGAKGDQKTVRRELMKKKILALILSGVMAAGLVGCGQGAAEAESQPAGNKETSAGEEMEIPVNDMAGNFDWTEPYSETVTLTVAREFVAYEFPEGEDLTNSVWTKAYKEKFNVDVVTDWISDDYNTKLNLAIASGKLPDVFTVNDVQLSQLLEAGLIMDLTEVYNKYASDTLKGMLEGESAIFDTAKSDGKIYAIPSLYFGYQPNILWLRQDWMKELNQENPQTVDELEEILRGMQKLSGGYSFSTDQTLSSLYGLAVAWGAYPKLWVEGEDGKLIYGSVAPEMKDALQAWAEWYKEGILKQDFATMNGDAVKEEVVAGRAGAETHGSWWGWTYGIDMAKNLGGDALFLAAEIPTVSGEKAKYPMEFPNENYIVVNKDCQNPEAVMKLINYYVYINNDAYASGEMTQEEIEKYTANNMAHTTKMFTVNNPKDDYSRYAMIAEARDTGDESVMTTSIAIECYNGTMKWVNDKDPDGVGYALQFGVKGSGMDVITGIIDDDRIMRSGLWGSAPQVLVDYGSTLDDILLEGFTKIIMGTEDISYFDTLVEQWNFAGGAEVTAAVNEKFRP